MPSEYIHKDFEPANKYELYLNGRLVYRWYWPKVNAEVELEMIEEIKNKHTPPLKGMMRRLVTVYKTTKQRIN